MAAGEHAKPVRFPRHHPPYINAKLEQRLQVFKDTIFILLQARGIHCICRLLTGMFAILPNTLVTVLFQEMFTKTPVGDLQCSLSPW